VGHHDHSDPATLDQPTFQLPATARNAALGAFVAGAALFGYGVTTEAWRGWSNGLIAAYYFVSIAMGAAVIVALMHVTKAGWGIVVRRVPEAISSWLPLGLLTLAAVTLLGMHDLYEWSHADIVAHDKLLQHKSALLNVPGFFMRMVIIIGGWSLLVFAMRRNSVKQDEDGDESRTASNVRLAAIFLVFFGVSVTFGALDWLMSLEPHWFSTMFGVYQFAGAHVAAAAVTALFTIGLKRKQFLPHVNENHLHDLGKMMFAFSTFWGYIWVMQYLLIWYANIPEETGHFLVRWDPAWGGLWALNVILNFAVPFFSLLPRPNKRNPKVLTLVALGIVLGHWLDIYMQVMPATAHFAAHHAAHGAPVGHGPFLGLPELGAFAMVAGLFVFAVGTMMGKASLLPRRDPYLQESLHHVQ
jgi:hypothetical protein